MATRSFSVYFTSTSMYMVLHRLFKKHRRKNHSLQDILISHQYWKISCLKLENLTLNSISRRDISLMFQGCGQFRISWKTLDTFSPILGGASRLPWGRKYVKILFSGSSSCTYVKLCSHRATASALVLTLRKDIMDSHCSIQRAKSPDCFEVCFTLWGY